MEARVCVPACVCLCICAHIYACEARVSEAGLRGAALLAITTITIIVAVVEMVAVAPTAAETMLIQQQLKLPQLLLLTPPLTPYVLLRTYAPTHARTHARTSPRTSLASVSVQPAPGLFEQADDSSVALPHRPVQRGLACLCGRQWRRWPVMVMVAVMAVGGSTRERRRSGCVSGW
jgi:hypothetical protein